MNTGKANRDGLCLASVNQIFFLGVEGFLFSGRIHCTKAHLVLWSGILITSRVSLKVQPLPYYFSWGKHRGYRHKKRRLLRVKTALDMGMASVTFDIIYSIVGGISVLPKRLCFCYLFCRSGGGNYRRSIFSHILHPCIRLPLYLTRTILEY